MESEKNGLRRATERAEKALVAVDGNCARKKAERMIVRVRGLYQTEPIWVAPR